MPSIDDLTDKIRSPEARVPVVHMMSAEVLGRESSFMTKASIREPVPSKKRKAKCSTQAVEDTKGGTITGYYFNFTASTLDILGSA
jgi:hypothetical protein